MSLSDVGPLFYWFFVGACLGSFLNVVVMRLPAGISIVRPRSRCPSCLTLIRWYDNIPLLSLLLLRARCRHCGAPIRWRYFLVELLMACLSAAVWMRFGWSWDLFVWLPLSAALLAITFLDIDEWWVPDVITLPAGIFALGVAFIPGGLTPVDALLGLAPAALALAVAWGFAKVTGKDGLGLGDVKLLAVIGLAVGLPAGLAVLVLAAIQGTVIGLLVQLTGGHRSMTDAPAPAATAGEATGTTEAEPKAEPRDEPRDEPPAEPQAEPPADSAAHGAAAADAEPAGEEEWVPPPRAFPFGPFLVLATYEVVLLPEVFADLPARLTAILIRLVGP